MFEHVTVLLSFIFAIAITHLLTSATELVWARDRVRFSGLHALWMFIALETLLIDWIGYWELSTIKHWSVVEVVIQFVATTIQYFTCSLLSLRPAEEGTVDMAAFFERQRRPVFMAFIGLILVSMFQNYWDRDTATSAGPMVWIYADLLVGSMLLPLLIAGWAKWRWLQWIAAVAMLCLVSSFLLNYALTA